MCPTKEMSWADVSVRPTDGAALTLSHLHDVVPLPNAFEVDARSIGWVPPGRPPHLRFWVEYSKRRSIPVERWKSGRHTLGTLVARRSYPNVLNGAPLQCRDVIEHGSSLSSRNVTAFPRTGAQPVPSSEAGTMFEEISPLLVNVLAFAG